MNAPAALDLAKIARDLDDEIARAQGFSDTLLDRVPAWVRRQADERITDAYRSRELFCHAHGWRVCDYCQRTVPSVSAFWSVIAGEIEICDRCRAVST